jgi:hypothetical protein
MDRFTKAQRLITLTIVDRFEKTCQRLSTSGGGNVIKPRHEGEIPAGRGESEKCFSIWNACAEM